jgi:class 3 adenylate cyclase/tetratricopeptide (TPR) repeat protein
MRTCTRCGAGLDRLDRYCRQCGFFLESISPQKEHRFVTIVFSDLSGYSTLSERLDPEELKELMDRVLREATLAITSYGGVVEKYIGDAMVAMFGIHQIREDDPIRAISAAREIHRAVGAIDRLACQGGTGQLKMHTGINTGKVLFDRCPSDLSSHGALGKPINIASRLCEMAPPGDILIGESLVSHAARYFHLEWLGRKILKGFRIPTHVYRIVSERKTPLPVHRDGGVVSPMVGRDHEISVLKAKARELLSGHGGVVCVTGEAGVGKSRLIQEFKASLDDGVSFFYALCLDLAKDTPYYPISVILSQVLGLDQVEVDLDMLSGKIEKLGIASEHRPSLSFLCGCSRFPGQHAPDEHKANVCDAATSLLSTVSGLLPTIFCIEDIHWADQSTMDLLGYIIQAWEASFPCLLVLSKREESRISLQGTHIHLRELPEASVARMLELMLDARSIPARTVQFLYEVTGGNPFYLEEMVNYLLDQGVDLGRPPEGRSWDDLPATLHGLIGSRLDSIGAQSRRILQEASIIGRIFTQDLLEAVSSVPDAVGSCLPDLMQRGFINRLNDHDYIFKHDLTREVACRAMLREERISLHRKIALELERRRGPASQEHSDVLAYHFESAQEYSKAIDYRMEAAQRYESSGSWFEAAANYLSAQTSLQITPDIPEASQKLIKVWEGIWLCSRIFNPAQAIAALEALSSHYRKVGLKKEETYALIRLINLYSQKGQFNKALQLFDYTSFLAADDPILLAALHTAIAYTHTFLGKPLLALSLLDQARPSLESSDRFLLAVNALTTLAAYVWKGDIDQAHKWYSRTKELSNDHMDLDLMAEMWFAHICCLEGSFEEAHRLLQDLSCREKKLGSLAGGLSYLRIQSCVYFRSRYFGDVQGARHDLEMFHALGSDIQGSKALANLYQAWICIEEGRAPMARDLIEEALPELMSGVANRVPYALNTLAEAYLLMGDLPRARKAALTCIEWNEINGNQDQLIWALRVLAQVNMDMGDLDAPYSLLKRSYLLARTCRMRPHMAWVLALWGDLMVRAGKRRKALACYRRSMALWDEMGNPHQIHRIKEILQHLDA